jgi:hypothetical protein
MQTNENNVCLVRV